MHASAKNILIFIFFLLAGFLIYSNAFDASFQFDDAVHIPNNGYIQIHELTPRALMDAAFKSPSPFRPVANMSFALNYYFRGESLFWLHFVNIMIHCISGLGIYLLVFLTLNLPSLRKKHGEHAFAISLFSALLFLTHPAQTAAVTYIVQRMTSLATMFYVYSLLFYAMGRSGQKKTRRGLLFASLCCGVLAVGSKEIALTLPFCILLYEFIFISEFNLPGKMKMILLLSFVLMGVSFGVFLFMNFPYLQREILHLSGTQSFSISKRLLTEPRVIFYYMSLLILPLPSRFNMDHDFLLSASLWEPFTTFLSIAGIIVLIGYAFKTMKARPVVFFCILWYFGNLFIESSFIPLALIYDHRIYLPSIGFILLIVYIIYEQKGLIQRAGQALLLIAILCNSYFAYQRNFAWKSPETLWRDAIKKSPNLARPHANLGNALLLEKKNFDEVLLESRIALQIDPNISRAYLSIGRVYHLRRSYDEAFKAYLKAAEIAPDNRNVYFYLGEFYDDTKDYEKAVQSYEKGLAISPMHLKARDNLEAIRQRLMDQYRKEILDHPEDVESRIKLAENYLRKGDIERAVRQYKAVLNYNERHLGALNGLGTLYMRSNRYGPAENYFQKTIQIDSENLTALYSLGMLSMKLNRPEDALRYLEEVVRLSPQHKVKLDALKNALGKK